MTVVPCPLYRIGVSSNSHVKVAGWGNVANGQVAADLERVGLIWDRIQGAAPAHRWRQKLLWDIFRIRATLCGWLVANGAVAAQCAQIHLQIAQGDKTPCHFAI